MRIWAVRRRLSNKTHPGRRAKFMQLVRLRRELKASLGQIVSPTAWLTQFARPSRQTRCQKNRSAKWGVYGSEETMNVQWAAHLEFTLAQKSRSESKRLPQTALHNFCVIAKSAAADLQEVARKSHHQSRIWSSWFLFPLHYLSAPVCWMRAALFPPDTRSAFISAARTRTDKAATRFYSPRAHPASTDRETAEEVDFYLIYWCMQTKENRFNCALIELTEQRFS